MGREHFGQEQHELELPNGVEVIRVDPSRMAELLKTAPVIIKWPFFEEVYPGETKMNVGAASCLMVAEFANKQMYSGHFTTVEENGHSSQKEQDDRRVYQMWLGNLQIMKRMDPQAKIILFGQHLSNKESARNSRTHQEAYTQRRRQVDHDLKSLGYGPDQVVDLRGPMIGSTSFVYDSKNKKLYYAVYPPATE